MAGDPGVDEELAAVAARAQAQEPDAAATRMMKNVLEATKNKNYDAFLSDADDVVRANITPQMFEGWPTR